MGTIIGYGSKHSHEFKLTVNETSTSIANNTSEISFSFTIYKASYSWSNWNSITYSISINDTSYSGTIPSYSAGSTLTLKTGKQTISHNSDGTKSINYSFSVKDGSGQSYTCGNASANGTLALTKIPRTPVFKTNPSIVSRGLNWIKFKYGSTDIASNLYYSLDNSNWVYIGTEETTISNLTPEKTYTIYVQARNQADSSQKTTKTISATTYAIAKLTSTPNVNIGSSHTIIWTNPGGASTNLKLCKTDNTTIIDYGTVTGTSKAITPTASTIYALTPNSNTFTARYIITTIANGKSYTNSKDFTFTVTNSNPTFSNFSYQDTNTTITALTGNNQILVNGYSNVKATISTANKATAKNSATMKSYKLLVGTKNTTANYNASADVNMSINQVNNNVIDLYAIDSRGNSTKVSKTATIKNYSNIKIKSLSLARQNNVGTVTTLKFEGEFWNASFGSVTNVLTTCKYKYKATSSSTWVDGKTTLTYTISGNKITGSLNIQGDLGTDGFNANSSYNIQLILADKLSTATYNAILSSGNPAVAIYKNNVAIGQQYDTNEGSKLQVNGDLSLTNRANRININGHKGILKHWTNDTQISANDGTIYLRPKGDENTTNQVTVNNDGSVTASKFNGASTQVVDYGDTNRKISIGYAGTGLTSSTVNYIAGYTDSGSKIKDINKTELQKWLRPSELYNNSSGTTGTVTLSETSANFNYLEIFYAHNYGVYGFSSVKVFAPNGKRACLSQIEGQGNYIVLYTGHIAISGTAVTFTSGDGLSILGTNFSLGGFANVNEMKIFRIIGYR